MKVVQTHSVMVSFNDKEVLDILLAHIKKTVPEAKNMKVRHSEISEGADSSFIEMAG